MEMEAEELEQRGVEEAHQQLTLTWTLTGLIDNARWAMKSRLIIRTRQKSVNSTDGKRESCDSTIKISHVGFTKK